MSAFPTADYAWEALSARELETAIVSTAPTSVLLISRWYGVSKNGVGVLTETLVQALRTSGTACVVLELLPDGVFPRTRTGRFGETIYGVCLREPDRPGRRTMSLGRALRDILSRRLIRRIVNRHAVNVAHFHHASSLYGTIASALRSKGVPWIVTFHGSDLRVDISDATCHSVMNDLVTAAGAVSAVSQSLRDSALDAFPAQTAKISVVYNSVDAAVVAEAERVADRGLDAEVVVLLAVLGRRKGADVLLHAWAELIRSGRAPAPWTLLIAGDGPDKSALQQQASDAGVADRVRFESAAGRAEIASLLTSASIMVVPSRTEPFGLVAAEGQMLGRPVIASDTGGLPEVIQNEVTGLLVPVEDSHALADAIARLIADPARRRTMGRAAHVRAVQLFAPTRMAREYLALYLATIDARPR